MKPIVKISKKDKSTVHLITISSKNLNLLNSINGLMMDHQFSVDVVMPDSPFFMGVGATSTKIYEVEKTMLLKQLWLHGSTARRDHGGKSNKIASPEAVVAGVLNIYCHGIYIYIFRSLEIYRSGKP